MTWYLQESGGKIGQSSEAFSKTRMCIKERHLHRSRPSPDADSRPQAKKKQAFHHRDASHDTEETCHCLLHAHGYCIRLLLSVAVSKKIICRTHYVHLHISEPTPGPSVTHTQPENTGPLTDLPAHTTKGFLQHQQSMSNSPSEADILLAGTLRAQWTFPAQRVRRRKTSSSQTNPQMS